MLECFRVTTNEQGNQSADWLELHCPQIQSSFSCRLGAPNAWDARDYFKARDWLLGVKAEREETKPTRAIEYMLCDICHEDSECYVFQGTEGNHKACRTCLEEAICEIDASEVSRREWNPECFSKAARNFLSFFPTETKSND